MTLHAFFPTHVYTAALQRTGSREFNRQLLKESRQLREDDGAGRRWSAKNYPGGYTSYASSHRLQRISPWGEHKEFDDNQPSYAVISAPNPAGSINDYQSFRTAKTKLHYGTKGNTFVAVVDFGDKLKARTILVNGESADPSSPHYTDQAQLYALGQLKDAFFYKEDVLKHMEVRYHPGNLKK